MPANTSTKKRRLVCDALEDDDLLEQLGISREVAKEMCRDEVESVERDIDQPRETDEEEDNQDD